MLEGTICLHCLSEVGHEATAMLVKLKMVLVNDSRQVLKGEISFTGLNFPAREG